MHIEAIYEQHIKPLPAAEQLRLVELIAHRLAATAVPPPQPHRGGDVMIANHHEFLVSLDQLQELELALASVKRDASSPESFYVQATSIQKEICRIRHEIDTYLGVTERHISETSSIGQTPR